MGKRQSEKTRQRQAEQKTQVRAGETPIVRVALPFLIGLLALSFSPKIYGQPMLWQSFVGACVVLAVWLGLLLWRTVSTGQKLLVEFMPRRAHYMQACVQGFIFFYWGWYWRQVYDSAFLILGQLLFAYAFDSLLCWSRREKWVIGFGPFPIVFSTNIFLWFRNDWFYWQFIMIGFGFFAKEFIRWKRDGKSTHVFNPSAFSLSVFAIGLIITKGTDLTYGQQIANTLFMPPKIYVVLFLLGLLAMFFFSTTLIAASTAVTLIGLGAIYMKVNGVFWFLDSDIPIAVFLGLHLLVTDPATSPKTPLGKAMFGVLYGVLVFTSYGFLAQLGIPTFYDKLLPIPIVNLCVPLIEKLVASKPLTRISEKLPLNALPARAVNVALMLVWISFFITMNATGHVGDSHMGKRIPFWQQACNEGRAHGCRNLIAIEEIYCNGGSGWACSELGANFLEGKVVRPDKERASELLTLACQKGRVEACTNSMLALVRFGGGGESPEALRGDPSPEDFVILLRGGKEALPPMSNSELMALACQQGWGNACTAGTPPKTGLNRL